MTMGELIEWVAYDNINPFGEERFDIGFAIVAQTIANANRGKDTKPYNTSDFIPKYYEEIRIKSIEEQYREALSLMG